MLFLLLFTYSFVVLYAGSTKGKIDPSDFLLGSRNRPRLEIIHPVNGQVLDTGKLRIEIKVEGYEVPSLFHGSKICIGISTGSDFSEHCFQQNDLVFHANNLIPGNQYALRVVLIERSRAIAVSVRHFRVAGIPPPPSSSASSPNPLLTIRTALQLAIDYHTQGVFPLAEQIYQQILQEQPRHLDALHLLGMLHYQQGNALAAVDLVEAAIAHAHAITQSSPVTSPYAPPTPSPPSSPTPLPSTQNFHTTLGVSYQRLGYVDKAVEQFLLAIDLNPKDTVSLFNLATVREMQDRRKDAFELYQRVNRLELNFYYGHEHIDKSKKDAAIDAETGNEGSSVGMKVTSADVRDTPLRDLHTSLSEDALLRSVVRECAMLGEMVKEDGFGDIDDVVACWRAGTVHFPLVPTLHMELGVSLAEAGEVAGDGQGALTAFIKAKELYEDMGVAANEGYEQIPKHRKSLSAYLLTLFNLAALYEHLDDMTRAYSTLSLAIQEARRGKLPTRYLLIKRATLLEKVPFSVDGVIETHGRRLDELLLEGTVNGEDAAASDVDNSSPLYMHFYIGNGYSIYNTSNTLDLKLKLYEIYKRYCPALSQGYFLDQEQRGVNGASIRDPMAILDSDTQAAVNMDGNASSIAESFGLNDRDSSVSSSAIKVLMVFSHLSYSGAAVLGVGALEVLIKRESEIDLHALVLTSNLLEKGDEDPLTPHLLTFLPSSHIHTLPPRTDIGSIAHYVRYLNVDVMVLPDVTLTYANYFLAFARLAPVQISLMGAAESSGVVTMDYFVTADAADSELNMENGLNIGIPKGEGDKEVGMLSQRHHSEKLWSMQDMGGSVFTDLYAPYICPPSQLSLLRRKTFASLSPPLPLNAHLYLLPYSISGLSPLFDPIIKKILAHDKVGYLVILTHTTPLASHIHKFFIRLGGGSSTPPNYPANLTHAPVFPSRDFRSRIIIARDLRLRDRWMLLSSAHVVLDPTPGAGVYLPYLEALALGTPVVTLAAPASPASNSPAVLSSRLVCVLYDMLGWGLPRTEVEDMSNYVEGEQELFAAHTDWGSALWKEGEEANEVTSGSFSSHSPPPLVVSTPQEYVATALKLSHQPALRVGVELEILRRRDALFKTGQQVEEMAEGWVAFLKEAVRNRTMLRREKV